MAFFDSVRSLFSKPKPAPTPQPEPTAKAHKQPPETIIIEQPAPDPPKQKTAPPKPEKPTGALLLGVPSENQHDRLWFPKELQERHCYIIGKTRTGKTTLMTNLIRQDMENGHGVCFIDPHGDASESLLSIVPKDRVQDVLFFDPSKDWCPPLNFFQLPYRPDKLTEDFISILRMSFDSWGPRLEHITRYGVLTLICNSKPRTLANLRTLFVNPAIREEILSTVTEPTLLEFWENEFPNMPKDVAAPLINKLSTFLVPGSPMLRIFSQPENALDFTKIMNGKILVVNLAKGILGDEPSRLLGGMLVASIAQAALARAELPPSQRKEFHLWIDEFQNFLIDSIQTILSEAGKYRLRLFMANQTTQQLGSDILASILGNVATLISFQISADDAAKLRKEMHCTKYILCSTTHPKPPIDIAHFVEARKKECLEKMEFFKNQAANNGANRNPYFPSVRKNAFDAAFLLEELDDANLDARKVKVLFPDWTGIDVQEIDFPTVDDFINLPARHAFCRMERAENVTMFRTLPPPEPVDGIDEKIIHAMQEAHAARLQQRAKKEPPIQQAQDKPPPPPPPLREIPPDELLKILKRPRPNGLDTQVSATAKEEEQIPAATPDALPLRAKKSAPPKQKKANSAEDITF